MVAEEGLYIPSYRIFSNVKGLKQLTSAAYSLSYW